LHKPLQLIHGDTLNFNKISAGIKKALIGQPAHSFLSGAKVKRFFELARLCFWITKTIQMIFNKYFD